MAMTGGNPNVAIRPGSNPGAHISTQPQQQSHESLESFSWERGVAHRFQVANQHRYTRQDSTELGSSLGNSSSLCSSCLNLDLEIVINNPQLIKRHTGKSIATFQLLPASANNGCGFCAMISAIQRAWNKKQDMPTQTFHLFAFSSRRTYRYSYTPLSTRQDRDCVFLSLVPADSLDKLFQSKSSHEIVRKFGYIGALPLNTHSEKGGPRPRSIGSRVDVNVLRTWVKHCKAFHGGHFRSNRNSLSIYSPCPCYQLIDCQTQSLVLTSHFGLYSANYVALSYVWGSTTPMESKSTNGNGSELPVKLPKVVEDAMTVTLHLRFRFLWVDRFCIPQNNHTVRDSQIARMAEIYKSAEVTIFAAAGNDSSYGLPGVSSTERVTQPVVDVAGRTVVWTLQDPTYLIQTSKWMTRGWTYQEAILSSRRLFFTDEQVYFECDSMYCFEALDDTPEILESKRKAGNYNGKTMFQGIRQRSEDIWLHISAYTVRQLTFESDILNGMQGIFCEYGKFGDAVFHHWGIPVSWLGFIDHSRSEWRTSFLRGLHWIPGRRAKKRRVGFPSWSWTGWVVPVISPQHPLSLEHGDINIWIECEDRQLIPWIECEIPTGLQGSHSSPKPRLYFFKNLTLYIHIETWIIPLKFELVAGASPMASIVDPGFYTRLGNVDGTRCPLVLTKDVRGAADVHEKLETQWWECAVLSYVKVKERENNVYLPFVIVLEWEGDTAERIGHVDFRNSQFIRRSDGASEVFGGFYPKPSTRRKIRLR